MIFRFLFFLNNYFLKKVTINISKHCTFNDCNQPSFRLFYMDMSHVSDHYGSLHELRNQKQPLLEIQNQSKYCIIKLQFQMNFLFFLSTQFQETKVLLAVIKITKIYLNTIWRQISYLCYTGNLLHAIMFKEDYVIESSEIYEDLNLY